MSDFFDPDSPSAESDAGDLPRIAVFDVDGVLADVRHRLRFVEQSPKNWASFFAAMDDDGPLADGITMAQAHAMAGDSIVYLTGRNESYRALTLAWMRRHNLPEGRLVMRRDDDRRPARLFKPQALATIARRGRVVTVVDDDESVVTVLRRDGWPVHHATWMLADTAQQESLFDVQEIEGRS